MMLLAPVGGSQRKKRLATMVAPSSQDAMTTISVHSQGASAKKGFTDFESMLTKGLSGVISPMICSQAGALPTGRKTSETNAIGRMVALARAGAAEALGATEHMASPMAAKVAVPKKKTASATGNCVAVGSETSKAATPTTIINTNAAKASRTLEATVPVRYAPLGVGVERIRLRNPSSLCIDKPMQRLV